jgi:RNA polymerase sigma-70 factor, ECF subfamily
MEAGTEAGGRISLRTSHKSDKKGSAISELDALSHWDYNHFSHMAGDPVVVEHPPIPLRQANANCGLENGEISAATYEKLRRLAAEYLRSERSGHTLQPTALLHEAFLRVLKRPDHAWRNEAHVIAFAARAMRRVLISYGRTRTREKRGGPSAVRLPLDEALDFCAERDFNLVAVDEALEELETVDPRQAQIVELRFFAGLTADEIASTLKISRATVKRDWVTAKLWLRNRLSD